MTEYRITNFKSLPVINAENASIKALIHRLKETLSADMQAIALAAPQLLPNAETPATDYQIFAVRGHEEVFINPEITQYSKGTDRMVEGCRSFPGEEHSVKRANWIRMSWIDESGNQQTKKFKGFEARVMQHEIDHLNGKMIK